MAQEYNEGHAIEGLDRIHVIMSNVGDYLDKHPAIVKAGAQVEIDRCLDLLMDAYQKVGLLD